MISKIAGPYKIENRLDQTILKQWYLGTETERKPVWIWTIDEWLQSDHFKRNPPSLDLFRRHRHVQDAGLQVFREEVIEPGKLWIISEAIEGKPLIDLIQDKPLPWKKVAASLASVAVSLGELHQAGLVHGRISIECLWYDKQGKLWLLRDPIIPPASPWHDPNDSILGPLAPQTTGRQYAAPELSIQGVQANASTDLYALGCLGYRMLTGKTPFAELTALPLQEAHRNSAVILPTSIECPDAMRDCLLHLMAKNSDVRFASPLDFCKALQAFELISAKTSSALGLSPIQASVTVTPSPSSAEKRILAKPNSKVETSSLKKKSLQVSTTRAKRNVKKKPIWLLPSIIAGSVVIMSGLIFFLTRESKENVKAGNPVSNSAASSTVATTVSPSVANANRESPRQEDPRLEEFLLERDNGKILWLPPHASKPYSLEMIPPGAQVFVFMRPDAWLQSEPGRQFIDLMGEELDAVATNLQTACSIPFADIQSLAIAIYPGPSGTILTCWRVKTKKRMTLLELKSIWGQPRIQKVNDQVSLLVKADGTKGDNHTWAYYVLNQPMNDEDVLDEFVCGPVGLIRESAELGGAAGPLRRQMEALLQITDSQSDLSLLFVPGFLFLEGKQLLSSLSPSTQMELKSFSSDLLGGLFTTSLGSSWYGELRLVGTSEQDASKWISAIQQKSNQMAEWFETKQVAQPAHPYWRKVAMRYPQMLRTMNRYQRIGIENGQAITNAYLPPVAASNVTIATWLAMHDHSGGSSASTVEAPKGKITILSADDVLARPIDMQFDQQSLETALLSIEEECNMNLPEGTLPLKFEIDGTAFERDGITRNKEVRDFRFQQQPVRLVLNELTKKANPEAVDSLNKSQQKVVWAIMPASNPNHQAIVLVTTRKAVESRSLVLPREFSL